MTTNKTVLDMKRNLARFLYDAVRDLPTLGDRRIELTRVTDFITQVKVWPTHDGPPEYFTIEIKRHI